jgi:acyl-CoA synthetase (AMP-forming)/AMP-acid ligase II
MIPDVRVADVIRRHAAERPESVALRRDDRELTYGALDER